MRDLMFPNEVSVLLGASPLAVLFHFPMEATEYWWYFGDEGSSNDKDPVHVYESPRIYFATLDTVHPNATYFATITASNESHAETNPIVITLGIVSPDSGVSIIQSTPSESRIHAIRSMRRT